MATAIGRKVLPQATGRPVRVSADGMPLWKAIGVTLAWDLIPAATEADTLDDDTPVAVGEKVIPFGTVLVQITGGDYDGQYAPYSSTPLIADPTDAPVGTEGDAGALGAGDYVIGYSFVNEYGETDLSPTDTVTLGASKKLHVAAIVLPEGADSVNWYMSKAADGTDVAFIVNNANGDAFDINALPAGDADEEPTTNTTGVTGQGTLTRGQVGIMDYTIKEEELTVMGVNMNNAFSGLIEGGLVWGERLQVGGSGEPTLSALLAVMPELRITPAE